MDQTIVDGMDNILTAVPYRMKRECELLCNFYKTWVRFHDLHRKGSERQQLEGVAQDMQDAHLAIQAFWVRHPGV